MKNVKEIEIVVEKKEWEEAIDKAFNKNKKDIKLDGFRKGSVSKEVYFKKAGKESLYGAASDLLVEPSYKKALEQFDEELACEPSVNIKSIDENGITYVFKFISKPEVKLGKYTKLGIKKDKIEVTEEEINHEIDHIKDHMAEVVIKENGTVENGNTAIIDFKGFVDGKELEGGSGNDYPLEIGSKTFIPGFEEGLVGAKTNEELELKLQFPKDYKADLSGKDVLFKVTIKEIKERIEREINEDFFEDLGIEGVDSLDKLKEHVKEEIEHKKSHQVEDKYIDSLLRKATENMEVEINPEIIESEIDRMVEQYDKELQMQGISLKQYVELTGAKMDDIRNMMNPQAEARIKTRYLLEEIIKVEKIEVTEKEVEEDIKENAKKYGLSEEEYTSRVGGKEFIKYDIEMNKALDIIKA